MDNGKVRVGTPKAALEPVDQQFYISYLKNILEFKKVSIIGINKQNATILNQISVCVKAATNTGKIK